MNLSEIIKTYRINNDISLDEFSKRCDLSKGYISMLENGINPRSKKPIAPTLPTLAKIANGLSVDVDVLLKQLSGSQLISLSPESSDYSTDIDLLKIPYEVQTLDIDKTVARISAYLDKIDVTYNGKSIDQNSKDALLTSLKTGLEIAKQNEKKKD